MKTFNTNPQFQNQPLRLDEAQTQYPESALDEFFEWYHLPDTRPILWQWLTVVLCSPRYSNNDPHARNNDIFFYEKLESLVEAAWVMRKGNSQQHKPVSEKPTRPINSPKTKKDNPTCFSKPPRLIEKATTQPIEVISEVFDQFTLSDFIDHLLPNWLQVAVINTQSPYSDGNGRELLYAFYDQLTLFVTDLYIASENQQLTNLSSHTDFFHRCSIDYLRRELADFLEAGIGHDGEYPNGFTPWQAWMAYNHILCLVEAAYQLYTGKQTVSNTPQMFAEY